jgi:hypothetical protein
MARHRTRVRMSRSLRVGTVALLAATTTTVLFEADIGRSLLLSSTMVAGAPPVIYALLAGALLRGAPLNRRLGWAVAACGVYAALGVVSGLMLSLAHPMSLEGALRRSLWSFAPAPFVHLLAAPLMLVAWRSRLTPLRLVVRGEPRIATPASGRATGASLPPASPDWDSVLHVSSPPVPWAPGASGTAADRAGREREAPREPSPPRERVPVPHPRPLAPSAPPAPDIAPTMTPAPASATPMVAAPATAAATPISAPAPARPASRITPEATPTAPARPAPKPAAPAPTPPRSAARPVATEAPAVNVEQEPVIRVPFDRIADQLPPEVFTLPARRLAESLQEPHVLLVPRRLVLPQLGEGAVEVAWTLVEGQFPELAFAMPQAEVRRRFPEWVLSLPMDVVVSQVPIDLFRVHGPAADLSGIGEFPAPFTPGPPEPESAAPSEAPPADSKPVSLPTSPVVPAQPAPVVAAPSTPARAASKPEAPAARAARPTVVPATPKAPEPRPVTAGTEVAADIPHVLFTPELPSSSAGSPVSSAPSTQTIPPPPPPAREVSLPAAASTVVAAPMSMPVPAPAKHVKPVGEVSRGTTVPPATATGHESEALAQALAPGLAPLGTFDWQARRVGGKPLLSFVPPALSREPIDTLAEVTATLVQRLASWGVEQLTVRTAQLACVLTPLGARGCLAATVERGGSVAMLEVLSARAAHATGALAAPRSPSIAFPVVGTVPATNGSGDGSVAEAARALAAFGSIAASVVEAEGTAPGVYVFAGRDQAVLAGAARAVYDALVPGHDQAALGRLESVVLRRGRERVVVRPLRRQTGAPAVLATAGEVALAGRAHRAAAQAAAVLEAR